MAKRTILEVLDDTDGNPNAAGHTFSLDGPIREIDLTPENYAGLRAALEPFIAASRPSSKAGKSAGRTFSRPAAPVAAPTASNGNGNGASHAKPAPDRKEYLAKAREWAKQNGHEVRDRGRVPAEILTAYDKDVRVKAREAKAAAKLAPAESVASPFKQPAAPRAPRAEAPDAAELLGVFKQLGTYKGVAEHYGVAVAVATKWVRAAQDQLDPVS